MRKYFFIYLIFIILIFLLPIIFTKNAETVLGKNINEAQNNINNSNEKTPNPEKAGDSNAKSNQIRQFFCLRQPSHR